MAIIQTPKRYAFVLDTTITNHIPRMTFSQSDVGSNILTISLTQNLVPYPLTATGLIINLFVVNGSSKSWQSSTDGSIAVTSTTGGTVEITLSSGTISNIGTNNCEINVQDTLGNDYTFPPFKFEVIANYANNVASTNDLLPLIQATSNANTAYTNSINYTKMETYDNAHAYLPLNKVLYQGGVYQNIIASTGISPTYNTNNLNWLCISPKSSDGYASIVPSSFTATTNNTIHIITGYTTYDKTHDTMQVIDATYGDVLIKNIDYTENADNLSIDLINNNVLNTGEIMIFNLYKNINDSTIQTDIANAITAKSNLDASISTGNTTKASIDASIASGQIGNVSTLATTSKIIVGAINENKANIDTINNTSLPLKISTNDYIRAEGYANDTGVANAYVITVSPVPTAYIAGQVFNFKAVNANTGASTLNVNGLGVKTLKKDVSVDLVTGDILDGQIVMCMYDGTYFQVVPDYSSSLASLTNTATLSANGIWKDKKTGFTIMWGTVANITLTSSFKAFAVTFPTQFNTACIFSHAEVINCGGTSVTWHFQVSSNVTSKTGTTFNIADIIESTATSADIQWFAFGY